MADIQVLNLDDLTAGVEKSVVLDGMTHVAVEATVDDYIERVSRAAKAKDDSDSTLKSQLDFAITLLTEIFPTLTGERLHKLSITKLNALVDFALKAPDDIAASAAEGNG